MELIAASKMRRAQERCLAGRPYDVKIRQVIADLAAVPRGDEEVIHPLLTQRPVNRIGIIHITADRGLCGGLNSNMNRRTAQFILEQTVPVVLLVVGRKGRDFMLRYGQRLRAEFTGLGDKPSLLDTQPIARIVIDDYIAGDVDEVYLAYTQFVTTMVQRPMIQKLLPVEPAILPPKQRAEYIFEPDPQFVLAQLLPRFIEMQIYHAILESIASEQSARMVAMRNATDNANQLIQDLTLMFNKARQEMITKEILDLIGATAVLT
jgi:F-type H+-transporting ATPase subunit gamma